MINFSPNHRKHRGKFEGTTSNYGWEAKVIQPTRRWGNADFLFSYITLLKTVGGIKERKYAEDESSQC